MGFKPNPNKKVRLDELSKAALIKTVKALQRRETKLLNEVERLKHTAGEACDPEGPSFVLFGQSNCGAGELEDQGKRYAQTVKSIVPTFPWEK